MSAANAAPTRRMTVLHAGLLRQEVYTTRRIQNHFLDFPAVCLPLLQARHVFRRLPAPKSGDLNLPRDIIGDDLVRALTHDIIVHRIVRTILLDTLIHHKPPFTRHPRGATPQETTLPATQYPFIRATPVPTAVSGIVSYQWVRISVAVCSRSPTMPMSRSLQALSPKQQLIDPMPGCCSLLSAWHWPGQGHSHDTVRCVRLPLVKHHLYQESRHQ